MLEQKGIEWKGLYVSTTRMLTELAKGRGLAAMGLRQRGSRHLPLDSRASKAMSWVDSFVIDKKCEQQCLTDAAEFIRFMNEDEVYMSILLPQDGVPAYLLPAKASLYSRQSLLDHARLYPKLKSIIENSEVPSDLGPNEELRNIGRRIDKDLSKP